MTRTFADEEVSFTLEPTRGKSGATPEEIIAEGKEAVWRHLMRLGESGTQNENELPPTKNIYTMPTHITHSAEETKNIARDFAENVHGGDIVLLEGNNFCAGSACLFRASSKTSCAKTTVLREPITWYCRLGSAKSSKSRYSKSPDTLHATLTRYTPSTTSTPTWIESKTPP